MIISKSLDELKNNLKNLPGIGEKTAQRLAFFIINQPKQNAIGFAESVIKAVESIKNCSICNMLTESEPCNLCSDINRKTNTICVVEHTQDVFLIEATGDYNGRYFVLGNLLSPIDGIGPEQIKFPQLKEYIVTNNVEELILALNPSVEGESTIHFLADQFSKNDISVTRLSTGIPFGGDIEYSNSLTLSNAIKRRYSV